MKEIKDFKILLNEIDRLAKKFSPKQKKQLSEILRVNIILLVALKKASNMGCYNVGKFM